MEADQLGRLRDILEASRLIASYMKGPLGGAIPADTQKQDAGVRGIEIIGEGTAHLGDETRGGIAALPFRKDAGDAKNRRPRLREWGPGHCWRGAPAPHPRRSCFVGVSFSKRVGRRAAADRR